MNNEGLHGMVERCATISLTAGLHKVYITGFQAGGGVGMEATYSGPDTGGNRIFMRSGTIPSATVTTPKYYPKCDPTAGMPEAGFTVCMFRSEVWLSQTPDLGNADTGLNRLYFVGKGTAPTVDLRDYGTILAVVPDVPDVNYAWAIYGTLPIASAGLYTLCITSDDGCGGRAAAPSRLLRARRRGEGPGGRSMGNTLVDGSMTTPRFDQKILQSSLTIIG